MKKTYLARRNALLSPGQFSWGMGVLVLALLMLVLRLVFPSMFLSVVSPFLAAGTAVSQKSDAFFSQFRNASRLAAENAQLRKDYAALNTRAAYLEQSVREMGALFPEGDAAGGIIAGVVARPPVSPYDTLMVNRGKRDGVTRSMEAFGEHGAPIGVVTAVSDAHARITLFSAPGTETPAWVGARRIALTLRGRGGGSLMALAARDANIQVGDVVYVPGPGALPVGVVRAIDTDSLSATVTLQIALSVNPFSVAQVRLRTTGITGISFATSTAP